MDIFMFNNPNEFTKMEQGVIINGLKSKMWIERYRTAGEFEFKAHISSGVHEVLTRGMFVSHVDSTEIMIVEDHQISDERGQDPEIVITGRSFETFLESRVAGANQAFPVSGVQYVYTLGSDTTWVQAKSLIEEHILASRLLHDDNAIPYIEVMSTVPGTGEMIQRVIKRGTVYTRLLELLAIDNLGIRSVRPGPMSPIGADNPNTGLIIHKGVDRSAELVLSYDTGELESADYLWSNRQYRNAALVTGKWVEMVVVPAHTGWHRRWMHVDASDIDESYEAAPEGATLTSVMALMYQRGLEALGKQNEVVVMKAEPHKEDVQAIYRQDFEVGDVLMVRGDYNETSKMRVTEYVEIEDETGFTGYPTLSLDAEET